MTSTQVVEMSVSNNNWFNSYPHPDDHTRQLNLFPCLFVFNFSTIPVSVKLNTYPCSFWHDCWFAVLGEKRGSVMHHTPVIIRKIKGINRFTIHLPEIVLET